MVPSDSKGYYLELPHLLLLVAILSDIISKYLLVINCHWGKKLASLPASRVTNALLFLSSEDHLARIVLSVYIANPDRLTSDKVHPQAQVILSI